ncbi:MAG: 3-hydroxyacyl-CoA dehydrogenase NAD-binding domain-containing protein, partial [Paracoccus sp. (in: a-proteobacteria)]|nr:3-hydroxyacyl-CoA dehydrogenase NAD-binding domain-containing protein [Paracoccus sp. (in: a-proteobacteria)]
MSRAQIARIAIFGGGAAGAEIARAALEAGLAVALLEEDAGAAERAAHYLRRALPARHAANLTVGTDLGAANGFDLAIEASRAPAPALAKLVAALAAQSAQGLIAAQVMRDTADLPALAAALPDPARLCGLAIAAPAHLRRLIEIIPAPQTAPETVAAIEDFAAALGKIAITPARGPLVPTLAARLYHAADTLLLDGSTPWEIDEAMEAYGLSPPPYEAQDLSGLDAALSARRGADLPGAREIPILSRMVQEGRLGAQAGVGWY